jgi:hypothetical protein
MLKVGQRFRTLSSIRVVCWWWYDTVAILEDYSDCAEATIDAGTCFTIAQIPEKEPDRTLCQIENEAELKLRVLPEYCRKRHWWDLSKPKCVSFGVEIAASVIETECEPIKPTR